MLLHQSPFPLVKWNSCRMNKYFTYIRWMAEGIRDSSKVGSRLYAGPDTLEARLILYFVACNYIWGK